MNPTTKKSNCENNNKIEEIKKLRKRIKVLRDSIKLSSSSLATIQNPHQTWKENTLFAVSNCIGNWRSIVLFYDLFLDTDENIAHHNEEGEVVVVEEAALTIDQEIEQMVQRVRGMNDEVEVVGDVESTVPREIFELIQMSLQSGPLTGAKPGYFKRCGSEIAEMVSDFLSSLDLGLDDDDDNTEDEATTITSTTTTAQNRTDFQYDKQRCLGMSMNQFQTICKWYKNALKAAESGAQPSKSMSRRMNQNYKPLKNNGSNSHKRKKKKKYLRPSY